MPDKSYAELVTAQVEVNVSDFQAKLIAADRELANFAKGARRSGTKDPGFSAFGKKITNDLSQGLQNFANNVMAESIRQVPKDTGVLAGSWHIGDTVKVANRIRVTFGWGYGDEINPKTGRIAAQYALPVHEIWDAAHMPPTKSHYLIDPVLERAGTFGPSLAVYVKATNQLTQITGRGTTINEDFARPDFRAPQFIKAGQAPRPSVRGPGGRFISTKKIPE